jgi:hypothetical protein
MIEFSLTGSVQVIDEILIHNNRLMVNIALNIIIQEKKNFFNFHNTYETLSSVDRMHTIIQEKKNKCQWWEIIRTEFI